MKTQENDFFVDKAIAKYQALSKKEKLMINLSIIVFSAIYIVEKVYNGGEVVGKFLYDINN
ncbi:hypothetical protein [Polaribacter sp. SA4-12]|uniref:hypothetical protein n=1 Tax=Polaribacter sp. SA4-12 TaxID=1312072 RepID=UPI000B3C1CFF|nr:hypothetical protein [Polaribacter sp. SA4-12]ARV14603.1 hypothetical protein BTO07_05300 [Polaribacter sp. SA4-12]